MVRDALVRVIREDPDTSDEPVPSARLRVACAGAARRAGRTWNRRGANKLAVAGTALAAVTVTVAVLATTDNLPGLNVSASGTDTSPSVAAPAPSASSAGGNTALPELPPEPSATASGPVSPSASAPAASPKPSPTASGPATDANALPAGFQVYNAPEGFSVALPQGWKRLSEDISPGNIAYRIVFGADDDPRTLTVTYSEALRADPVAVWRDDVQPGLIAAGIGFQRIGEIRATNYRGRSAADMEWTSDFEGIRIRTFGRGFLTGQNTGYSLRWTTPAADWNDTANRRALETFLRTFRE